MSAAFGGRRFHSPDEPGEEIDLDYPGDGDRPPEWLTDYYEDEYPSGPFHDDHEGDHTLPEGFSPYSLSEIFENCIQPTVNDGLLHIGKLLFWCFIFRISAQSSNVPPWLSHLLSAATGIIALSHFFYTNVLYLIALSGLSYFALLLAHKLVGSNRGLFVTASCLTFNTLSELFIASPQDWHQVRGAQMILTMKAISLGFDLDDGVEKAEVTPPVPGASAQVVEDDPTEKSEKPFKKLRDQRKNRRSTVQEKPEVAKEAAETIKDDELCLEMPTVWEYFGYTLCPGNSIFGPWTTFSDYLNIFREPRWNSTWLVKILLSMIYGFMFLTISTCWNPWLIPDGIWIWWTAYRDAMSFRASHYFVSYISEASAVTAGFGSSKENSGWHVQVTQPHDIEVPRSLTEVVKSWNIPMHKWLKTYCFKKARRYGNVSAVLTTYLASTMLHGLNFQLGAVLLSLGFYTYVEHKLRSRLAVIFDASVAASKKDGFRHKEGETVVMMVNLAFGLLVCFNLAYLGVMFSQDNTMEEGYSWQHTLMKWDQLGFVSHWLMFAMFVFALLI